MDNASELGDVPEDKISSTAPFSTSRCIRAAGGAYEMGGLRYPNSAMAQMAEMSTEAFEDFYFKVCNLDYAKCQGHGRAH